jgi:hypothetical protein
VSKKLMKFFIVDASPDFAEEEEKLMNVLLNSSVIDENGLDFFNKMQIGRQERGNDKAQPRRQVHSSSDVGREFF